jgi:hypothetical protein
VFIKGVCLLRVHKILEFAPAAVVSSPSSTPARQPLGSKEEVKDDTCVSYEEEDTCVSYEEEDTCVSYEQQRGSERRPLGSKEEVKDGYMCVI